MIIYSLIFLSGLCFGIFLYWLFDKKIKITISPRENNNLNKINFSPMKQIKESSKEENKLNSSDRLYKATCLINEIKLKGKLPCELSPAVLHSLTIIAKTPEWEKQLDDESIKNLNRIYDKWQRHVKASRVNTVQHVGAAGNMDEPKYWEGTEEEYFNALEEGIIDEDTKVEIITPAGYTVRYTDGTVEEVWDNPEQSVTQNQSVKKKNDLTGWLLSLEDVTNILEKIEEELNKKYRLEKYVISDTECVYVIEDSLVLLANKVKYYNPYPIEKSGEFYFLKIEELTYNSTSFNYENSEFYSKILQATNFDCLNIHYKKYFTFQPKYDYIKEKVITTPNTTRINELVPELKLKDRINRWEGLLYYIVVFEIVANDGKKGIGIFYTSQKPYLYVYNRCNNWIKKGFNNGNMNMIGQGPRMIKNNLYPYHLEQAFYTYGNECSNKTVRESIIENNLTYFFLAEHFRTKEELENQAYKIYKKTCKGDFVNLEREVYKKPQNKWISEELVYNITKKLYKKYNVIYQYRPSFLISNLGGQMSYDVYIEKLEIAIEYQGKQHFEPVEFFGGKESFIKTIKRDKLKEKLSKDNGIKLIYVNYWETITPELIKDKIENCRKL